MIEVERGWSSGLDRKMWRFLARSVPGRRQPLRGGHAVASLTFDDVADSAALLGAPILERRGQKATFYVAAGIGGQQDSLWRLADRGQIRALSQAGHEIGCHTAHHVNVQSLHGAGLLREIDLSSDLIAEICGRRPRNFCYPFGDLGLMQKRVLAQRFETCRTIYEHTNTGRVDPALLGAHGLFDAVLDRARLERLVRDAVARRGWLIFYTHDVADAPTRIGASPRLIEETLAVLAEHGVPVMSVAEAARHHGLVQDDRVQDDRARDASARDGG